MSPKVSWERIFGSGGEPLSYLFGMTNQINSAIYCSLSLFGSDTYLYLVSPKNVTTSYIAKGSAPSPAFAWRNFFEMNSEPAHSDQILPSILAYTLCPVPHMVQKRAGHSGDHGARDALT